MLGSQNDTAPPEPSQPTVPYPEPPPALTASGWPAKNYQPRPAKYRDVYPEGMTPAVPPPTVVPPAPASSIQCVLLIVRNPLSTTSNIFGMWRGLYPPP